MAKKLTGLGKGLDALFPTNLDRDEVLKTDRAGVREIFIEFISPKSNQPRTLFDNEKIEQLSYSIKQHGILQPLVLVEIGLDSYVIVAGERRYRAAKIAGLTKVPAVVRTANELEQLEIALVENIQREDLSPLEQAAGIKRLYDEFGQSYQQIAKRLGKAESTVVNLSRLMQLPEKYQEALRQSQITEGHARSLLSLNNDPEAQEVLFANILNKHWNVRQAEIFVNSYKKNPDQSEKAVNKTMQETPQSKILAKKLNRMVRIKRTAKGGTLNISFQDDNDLEKLLKSLT
ncbi:ParB/RepB/Spo0J family partition protein [Candidatus Saccharibacteria bacterium]|nr:ParB/RepB/Spo0J family partition protein [Candidatus Saccharibacteria bacterium]